MTENQLDQIITSYGGAVRTICLSILSFAPQDAEEAESDTFVKLWRMKNLPEDEGILRGYVIRTARSCAIDRYRKLKRRGITFSLDERDEAAFSVELDSHLEAKELVDLIMELPPPEGELFIRRYLYGESAVVLSQHYEMPETTIRTKMRRAREKLKKILGMEAE